MDTYTHIAKQDRQNVIPQHNYNTTITQHQNTHKLSKMCLSSQQRQHQCKVMTNRSTVMPHVIATDKVVYRDANNT